MLTDLQRQNLAAGFDLLDASGNGYIEANDFQAEADRQCAALGVTEGTQQWQDIQDAYRAGWEQIRIGADIDYDGRVSRDEYLAAVESRLGAGTEFQDAIVSMGEALFRAADKDGTGVLRLDEFTLMANAANMDAASAEAAFKAIDTDDDGTIGFDEYIAAYTDYLGTDPDRPGARMLRQAS